MKYLSLIRTILIVIVAVVGYNVINGTTDQLLEGLGFKTQKSVEIENKALTKDLELATKINEENLKDNKAKDEAKQAVAAVVVEAKKAIEKDTIAQKKKIVQYKKAADTIEKDTSLSEEEKSRQFAKTSIDAIWDTYCQVETCKDTI